jgi:Uncharacterized conserved protein
LLLAGGIFLKTYAYTIELKKDPELISEYIRYHGKVWPEVLKGLNKKGIISDRIFILGTRLFMLIEAEDDFNFQEDIYDHSKDIKEKEWEKLMQKFQIPVEDAGEGEWWAQMELIFDLEEQLKNISLKNSPCV